MRILPWAVRTKTYLPLRETATSTGVFSIFRVFFTSQSTRAELAGQRVRRIKGINKKTTSRVFI
jgi:hypothetical protein